MSRRRIDSTRFAARAVMRLATWLKPRTVFLGDGGGDAELVVESFRAWCATHAGTVCELALSSRWVVCCVPPEGAGSMTERELRHYAGRQIAHYLEDARRPVGARWAMAVSDRPEISLACAATGELIDRLTTTAKAHHVTIRRVFPWWLAAVWPVSDSTCSVVAVEPTAVTTLQFMQGRLHRLSTDFDIDQGDADAWKAKPSEQAQRREITLWRSGQPMPVVCDDVAMAAVIAMGLSSRHRLALDLLGTPPRAWWGSWALLLLAVACALVQVRRQDGLWAAQAREQALLERIQASHARTRPSGKPASSPVDKGFKVDGKTLEAAAEMLAIQQHPWADVFAGVESASNHVAMLSLQHDASQLVVDIEVAVQDDDAAWGFAQKMAADPTRFKSATLLTQQALETPTGALTSRARVQAVLAALAPTLQDKAP